MTYLHRKLVVLSLKFETFLNDKLHISNFKLIGFIYSAEYMESITFNVQRRNERGDVLNSSQRLTSSNVHQLLLNVSCSFDVQVPIDSSVHIPNPDWILDISLKNIQYMQWWMSFVCFGLSFFFFLTNCGHFIEIYLL